jgi:pyrimidine-nucleoside phosphorylase
MTRLPSFPQKPDDDAFSHLVEWAKDRSRTADDVALLAEHLAASGEQLRWLEEDIADVASTGGPGSLSTLIAPLALRGQGCAVVKLAVPGRPAGAIDVLGTLPGYRVRSTSEDVRATVARCGFAHFLADARFAPLDAAFFQYRKRVGAIAVPVLAAASLLAKKLAVGVHFVGLDVRVGEHGNFGTTIAEARANASLFCAAARALGVHATAFISTGNSLAQPFIGRGESLIALANAVGAYALKDPSPWLNSHVAQCQRMAAHTVANKRSSGLDALIGEDTLRTHLGAHLEAQGSSIEALRARAHDIAGAPQSILEAPLHGILSLDLHIVREALVELQADKNDGVFQDVAGLQILRQPGALVAVGEPVARVRCESVEGMAKLLQRLKRGIHIRAQEVCTAAEVAQNCQPGSSMEVVYA